jgi:hypothetical protein
MNHEKRKRLRWLAAGSFTFVLITAAVLLLTTSQHKGSQATRPAQPRVHAQACPVTTSTSTIPAAPPSDVVWKSVGAMLVPTSATAGPAHYDGPVWECYAHSPMGAVLAAYDITATLLSPQWHTVAEQEIAPGPGRQAFLSASEGQSYQPLQPGEIAQPVGFQVAGYTPQQATVETLAADTATGGYQEDEWTLAWTGGDWKLVMTAGGQSGPDPQPVTSANGFVLWGGASDG